MRRTSFSEMDCSVAQTLEVIGEWWTLLILRDTFQGVRRFDDFQRRTGVARNVLTQRLERLVEHGILERRRYQDRPARHEYRLTDKGLDLYPVVIAMMDWGDRWAYGDGDAPVVLTHKPCGHEGTPVLTCSQCGEKVTARQMRFRYKEGRPRELAGAGAGAGPGATVE
jgi:DNA-binding HxlR family transcriptional regulator